MDTLVIFIFVKEPESSLEQGTVGMLMSGKTEAAKKKKKATEKKTELSNYLHYERKEALCMSSYVSQR